jgi:hypothetical protein
MTKQGTRRVVLILGVLLGAVGARAEETGIAEIHNWMKVGRKTCMVDHFHSGSGSGATKAQAARQAIQAWADFTAWEYGSVWGRYSISTGQRMSCDQTGSWSCFVEARPCRPY